MAIALAIKHLSIKHNYPWGSLSMVYSVSPLLMDIWVVSNYLLLQIMLTLYQLLLQNAV